MKVVVYTGPTLSADDVHAVLPEATVVPPAARGDLLKEEWGPDDTAVIIDGYYRERLSVGHKEILWLLNEGVHVIGAASMGALRAAELSPFGMNGVGEVYEMFSSGAVDGDDEVAVMHGPAERGYQASTVALVNLRHGVARGTVDPEAGARIIAAAKARPFTHRSWDELAEALDPGDRPALAVLREEQWDVKRLDALLALEEVSGERPDVAGAWSADIALTGITHYEALKWRSARDLDVMNAARLFAPEYPDVHAAVLEELLTEFGGEAYTQEKLGVYGDELPPELAKWLAPAEHALPMAERLKLVMMRVWPVWQSEDWRRAVLDRLRAHEKWDEWSGLLIAAKLARATAKAAPPPPEFCARLFLRHWKTAPPHVEMARRGFYGMDDLGRTATPFFALDAQRRR
ncbi:TfuA-like protein [Herbidospora mongoliensis]|uniref:TfuA-like protein n=1 Tax=Herbidospora mongoliensis TaxID=688067 RepID=UPI0008367651|nr:TfuA-like protein [Herbidospora mongoliensis]